MIRSAMLERKYLEEPKKFPWIGIIKDESGTRIAVFESENRAMVIYDFGYQRPNFSNLLRIHGNALCIEKWSEFKGSVTITNE